MDKILRAAHILADRQKAKEITSRVIKRGDKTGERFGDILQEELDKLKGDDKQ